MKSANKEKLLSYFQNNYQYNIPFFQRAYVWGEENWDLLLDHINEEADAFKTGEVSEHFIGTIITKPASQTNFSVNAIELIDGQQRLTTVSILLKALADTCTGEYSDLKSNLMNYLKFKDSQGKVYSRISHSKNDEPHFEMILQNVDSWTNVPVTQNQINKAYHHFCKKVKDLSDSDRDLYQNVLLNKLPIIAMFLGEEDDEQEIFDTINSLGVRLTVAELLKNFLFRDDTLKTNYDEYWFEVFEKDEVETTFWNDLKTSGRVKRTNLELLLYCFLIIETGSDVRLDKLFNSYKKYLKDKTSGEKLELLKRLKSYATIYRQFPSNQELKEIKFKNDEKRVFHVIEYLEITTVYPLLLYTYQNISEEAERNSALSIIESFLVRRLIVKLTTKGYNRFFIQLINELKTHEQLSPSSLRATLLTYEEDSNRWPSDSEVTAGMLNNYLYNKYTREILFIICLYLLDNKNSDINAMSVDSYSVEHMLPKKWREHWSHEGLSEDDKLGRDKTLKTLGNLTLVTQPLNSKLTNNKWSKKKKDLRKNSHLSITRDFVEIEEWNEQEILSRGKYLAAQALLVWQR